MAAVTADWDALRFVNCRLTNKAPKECRHLTPVTCTDWRVFLTKVRGAGAEKGSLGSRYRLAGTFMSSDAGGERRKAVLDDLTARKQLVLSEQDVFDGIRVVSIFRDSVILASSHGEERISLSFLSKSVTVPWRADLSVTGREEGAQLGEFDKYGGRQIGENSWLFRRQSVLDYYTELMENPERLVRVFDSLKPVRDQSGTISGYRLGVEGEADFFKSTGISENDVIRSVNSVPMTNRRRAESFIKDFVQNRVNAFVMDVERDGRTNRFVYQVR